MAPYQATAMAYIPIPRDHTLPIKAQKLETPPVVSNI